MEHHEHHSVLENKNVVLVLLLLCFAVVALLFVSTQFNTKGKADGLLTSCSTGDIVCGKQFITNCEAIGTDYYVTGNVDDLTSWTCSQIAAGIVGGIGGVIGWIPTPPPYGGFVPKAVDAKIKSSPQTILK